MGEWEEGEREGKVIGKPEPRRSNDWSSSQRSGGRAETKAGFPDLSSAANVTGAAGSAKDIRVGSCSDRGWGLAAQPA